MQAGNYEPLDSIPKACLAIGLSWVAGFVDVVGYTVLNRILSANMSGNTVRISYYFVRHDSALALASGGAVLFFVLGLFLCATLHEACQRHGIRSAAAVTLGLEALLLVVFVFLGSPLRQRTSIQAPLFYILLVLSCVAMGLQNATLSRIGALTVRTTHVTGMLAQFAESGSRYLFWFYDKTRGAEFRRFRDALRLSLHHQDFVDAAITGSLWIGFFAGAFCGVLLHHIWGLDSLLLPVALLAAFVAIDLARPFTVPQNL